MKKYAYKKSKRLVDSIQCGFASGVVIDYLSKDFKELEDDHWYVLSMTRLSEGCYIIVNFKESKLIRIITIVEKNGGKNWFRDDENQTYITDKSCEFLLKNKDAL